MAEKDKNKEDKPFWTFLLPEKDDKEKKEKEKDDKPFWDVVLSLFDSDSASSSLSASVHPSAATSVSSQSNSNIISLNKDIHRFSLDPSSSSSSSNSNNHGKKAVSSASTISNHPEPEQRLDKKSLAVKKKMTAEKLKVLSSLSKETIITGNRYALCNQVLGRGAGTVIELAKDLETNQLVALKMFLLPDLPKLSPTKRELLLEAQRKVATDEARIMGLVSYHPNVVRLLNTVYDENNVPCLVMNFVNGTELFNIVSNKGRLTETEARPLFQQIIQAVGYIHANGLIHNDIKLENTLVEDDIVTLVDFGLSIVPGDASGAAVGEAAIDNQLFAKTVAPSHGGEFTVEYASPEAISGDYPVTFKSDVWSCGIVLYAMVCGFLPFDGSHTHATRHRILHSPLRFYSPFDKTLTLECKDLITRILDKNPEKRLTIEQIKNHDWFLKDDSLYSPADDNNPTSESHMSLSEYLEQSQDLQ